MYLKSISANKAMDHMRKVNGEPSSDDDDDEDHVINLFSPV